MKYCDKRLPTICQRLILYPTNIRANDNYLLNNEIMFNVDLIIMVIICLESNPMSPSLFIQSMSTGNSEQTSCRLAGEIV